MSHYAVLAFGEDVDIILEPYNENIEVEEYFVDEVPQEDIDRFIKFYKEKLDKEGSPLQEGLTEEEEMKTLYEQFGMDWNGNDWRLEDGKWNGYSTYNPIAKWDWYQEGGRFYDYFELKPGSAYKDVLTIADFDFSAKAEIVRKEAEEEWERANEIFNRVKTGKFRTWKEINETENIQIEDARDLYKSQPEVIAFEEEMGLRFYLDTLESYLVSKEDFVNNRIYTMVAPFAYVSEETGWQERGEMGWFGMSFNEKPAKEWYDSFMQFINSIPQDTEVTVVDCHI